MRSFLAILFIILSIDSYSQDLVVVDTAKIVCSYEYKYVCDTLIGDVYDDLLYLQVGDMYSKCYSYYTFRFDSLRSTPQGHRELSQKIAKFGRILAKENGFPSHFDHPFSRLSTRVYKNYHDRKIIVSDYIISDYFIYDENLNLQDWELTEDSIKIILGYECQMATCRFRGREWTAWFALDVPISDGPWKFSGLPGLIMEAYDKKKTQYFCINGIQNGNSEPIYFGSIGIDANKFEKTTQRKFLKAVYEEFRSHSKELHIYDEIGLPNIDDVFVPRFDWLEKEER